MEKRELLKSIIEKHLRNSLVDDPNLGIIRSPDTVDELADEILANEYLWFG